MVAVAILDFKARARGIDDARAAGELYELWMRRIDRMGIWDLIDRSAPRVLGLYLLDKPRDPLFTLAASADVWHSADSRGRHVHDHPGRRPRRSAAAVHPAGRRSGEVRADRPGHGAAGDRHGRPGRLRAFLAAHESQLSAAARRVARTALTER